ncbi:MAG: DUF4093 domain-containing protein [Oscillospiraceae bacterium]|nr:DUF4093 domain-containing protein [Oscillospiraceae bacterium]
MLKIKQAIIVEGKYDKIRLSNLVDAVIIPTNGFALYHDKETVELIKMFAKKTGIIILTDSDSAGFQIRSRLRSITRGGEVINVYIPDIMGKERRKRAPSAEGKLGVEGVDDEILLEAFRRAGVFAEERTAPNDPITKADLMELGYVGGENSAEKRAGLQRSLGLPARLSANMLLEVLNVMYSREEFLAELEKL